MALGQLALVLVGLALLARGNAVAGETDLTVATTGGLVAVQAFTAPGQAKRPTVLVLHGRAGMVPLAGYRRYAADLAAAGMDAWLFSYYGAADDEAMRTADRTQRNELFTARFRAWVQTVSDTAGFALARAENSGRVGLLGFSNGGFLTVGTAAADRRIGALVVFYGGIPRPMRDAIARLPPLLELHGDAEQIIPIAEGRALVERAKALGGFAEQVVYPGADHGFDFAPHSYAGDDAISRAVAFLRHQLGAD